MMTGSPAGCEPPDLSRAGTGRWERSVNQTGLQLRRIRFEMPRPGWRDHWLFGALDLWLMAAIAIELLASWRWGLIGAFATTILLAAVIAVGFLFERRIWTNGQSKEDKEARK
jgi:hypothetical protein